VKTAIITGAGSGIGAVRVNCVAPGFIDAGMSAPFYADPAIREQRGSRVPMGRLGAAEDVAAAVLFLASDEASYINGHQLVVDDGVVHSLLAQMPVGCQDVSVARNLLLTGGIVHPFEAVAPAMSGVFAATAVVTHV